VNRLHALTRSEPATLPKQFTTAVMFLSTGAFFSLPNADGAVEASSLVLVVWGVVYLVAAVALIDGAIRARLLVSMPPALLVFIGLTTASVLWSAAPGVTTRRSLALIGTVTVGLLLAQRLPPIEILDAVRRAVALVAVLSLLLLVIGDPRAIDPVHDSLRGVLATKNTLGRVMGLGILATATTVYLDRSRARRAVVAGVPMVIALALTDSAGGTVIASLVLILVLTAALWRARSGQIFMGAAVALALGGIAFALPATTAEDAVGLLGRDLTITGRTEIWSMASDALMRRPLLGYGYGAFWHEDGPIEAARIWALLYWPVPNAHNGVLDVALGVGLVGAALAVILVGGLLVRAVLDARAGRRQSAVFRSSVGLLIVVSNLVESSLLQENAYLTLLLVAGLTIREPPPQAATAATDRAGRHQPSHTASRAVSG
jgi:exopolysaccharide production protein ExoQ